MRLAFALVIIGLVGCSGFIRKSAVKSTSVILLNGQPAMQMESDYELARQAIPGALKTVESFWMNQPGNPNLRRILTEGYCQYGTAFVEDDWEVAVFKKDLDAIEYHNTRSTHIFTRCLNYALMQLPERWKKDLFAEPEVVAKLIAETGGEHRFAMMFAGMALGSIINHNLTRIEMLAHLPTVELIMKRVIQIDEKGLPANKQHAALPYVALGMFHSARPKAMGGNPDEAKRNFETAIKITDGKFLLARTLMAFRVGKQTNDRKYFHEELKKVIETDPAIWPEQRLANEVAHRKARRYLSKEKEIF
jgi:hypothetical protein